MLVGITGGIGSGKSTIAHELQQRGFAVFNTDAEAKQIIVSNPMVRSQVEMLFGSEVFEGDVYQTRLVAKQVFHHPDLRLRLNAVVHPAVAFRLQQWTKEQDPSQPCFVESAILFESGLDKLCSGVVRVEAPEEVRIARVVARDYKGEQTPSVIAKIRQRIAAQTAEEAATSPRMLRLANDGTVPLAFLVDRILRWTEGKEKESLK